VSNPIFPDELDPPPSQNEIALRAELDKTRRELNEFIYIIAHDLQAPLRGIDSLASWIVDDYQNKLDAEGQEMLTLLVKRVQKMQGLLDGMLELSRIGRITQGKKEVDLEQLVPKIIKNITFPPQFKVEVKNKLPPIWAEENRIIQLFENLLDNALKFVDKPQGHVEISCADNGNQWQFSIADNGPGLEERHFDRVFQVFQTLQPPDQTGSSGMGLTIAKKIAQAHGGQIWVESTVGQGTTFHFTLPKQRST